MKKKPQVIDKSMPVFSKQFYSDIVPENIELHTPLSVAIQAESPLGRKLIYTIVKGNELEEFSVDFNTGMILPYIFISPVLSCTVVFFLASNFLSCFQLYQTALILPRLIRFSLGILFLDFIWHFVTRDFVIYRIRNQSFEFLS